MEFYFHGPSLHMASGESQGRKTDNPRTLSLPYGAGPFGGTLESADFRGLRYGALTPGSEDARIQDRLEHENGGGSNREIEKRTTRQPMANTVVFVHGIPGAWLMNQPPVDYRNELFWDAVLNEEFGKIKLSPLAQEVDPGDQFLIGGPSASSCRQTWGARSGGPARHDAHPSRRSGQGPRTPRHREAAQGLHLAKVASLLAGLRANGRAR
jgi:hypothetical protein